MPRGAPLGNQNGAKENRLWGDCIKRAVAQSNGKKLRAAADALIDSAIAGDVGALRELGDRIDGKVSQPLEHSGDLHVTIAQSDANL